MTTTPLPPPALWHDQTTGQWKVLTKPDRPTYEAYYTAEQVHQARADLEAENKRLREALQNLLNDTQHAEHPDCDDGPCPVREARAALESKP